MDTPLVVAAVRGSVRLLRRLLLLSDVHVCVSVHACVHAFHTRTHTHTVVADEREKPLRLHVRLWRETVAVGRRGGRRVSEGKALFFPLSLTLTRSLEVVVVVARL